MQLLATRQIHLDYHTSGYIPDVAASFDAKAFAQTFKQAHVNSATVFARCHHGYLYYDSKNFPERVHPHLVRKNLLLEQVRALHAQGIRAPIYLPIQWDYYSALHHPEWLIRRRDGSHEGPSFDQPGFTQSLCVNTAYYDFLETHVSEIFEMLPGEVDGFFFDITKITPCWCASCSAEMAREGVDEGDEAQVRAFAGRTMTRFKQRLTALVRRHSSDCTIFYNAGHVGPCTKAGKDSYSHFEVESLPSGYWGYLHFPIVARYARQLGKDVMGMTGKFHTDWGDFHSLKNRAALEYECFRTLSYGYACSIGDQLEPCGTLNPHTYHQIGEVYRMVEEREAWARPSLPLAEAALLTSEDELHENVIHRAVMGAVQMLDELGLQYVIIDQEMDYTPYPLLIIPDEIMMTEAQARKVDRYVAQGGKVIACFKGGLSEEGRYPACYGAVYRGLHEKYPDFVLAQGELGKNLYPDNAYVVYRQGADVEAAGAVEVLWAQDPYFRREGDHFCSHLYTPSEKGEKHPAALRCGNVLLFAHPLLTQYRLNGPRWCKVLMENAIDLLLGRRMVRHNGPSTLQVHVLDLPEKHCYAVHLLSYIPIRKSETVDIIEERTRLHQVTLTFALPRRVRQARLVPEGEMLELAGDTVTVPVVDGYAIVELAY